MQPVFYYKLKQIITITILWIIIGIFVELYNSINYHPISGNYFFHVVFGNNLFEHLLITAIGPLIGGIMGGSFIVLFQRERLKTSTYTRKLFLHSFFYIFFVSLCIVIVGAIGALNSTSDDGFYQKFYNDVFSLRVARLLFIWYFIVVATIFLLDVSEKYGSGIFKNLLLGKYHKPGIEERIFMFLDLNSSTTIAETIGDEKYFQMLRYFYQVVNKTIINYQGEIYQYIGDEIVVSWEMATGIKDNNCFNCFQGIKKAVEHNTDFFNKNYGVVPGFKAAIHSGKVITGEIGLIKKDIVYSGDVLNATERMVSLCRTFKQELIISENIYNHLNDLSRYEIIYLGESELRGKSVKARLYGVKSGQQ